MPAPNPGEPSKSPRSPRPYASFVTATTIPINTKITIATCIQIHVGGIAAKHYLHGAGLHGNLRRVARRLTIVFRMSKAIRRLAVTLAAVLPALLLPAARSAAQTPLVGLNVTGLGARTVTQAESSIATAHRLHASIVRMDFPWSFFEPTGPTLSPAALAQADQVIGYAAALDIKIVATVDDTPCWASSAPAALVGQCQAGLGGNADAWPPSEPGGYASLLSALATRYGSRLAAIEIWNEPDQANEDYFAGPDKAARYAVLLKAAYPAVKQADPTLPVLAASMVGSNGNFLRALYANGIKGYYDGLSVHYYGLTLGAVRAIREVQTANGDDKPIWLDEFGWSSCWPARRIEQEQACVTTRAQAANLRNTIRELARAPYLAAAIVYKLQDSRTESFGALTTGGRHKPSYSALSQAFANPLGPFARVSVKLRRSGGRIVASGEGPQSDYMGLEAFVRGRLRYRALFVLNRFNRYSIALPAVLGTRSVRVKVFQYWAQAATASTASL